MCDNRHCSLVIIHLLFHSQRNPMPLWYLPSWLFVHHSQWLLLLRTLCLVFIYLERTQPHTNTRLIEARDHQPLDGSLIQETPPRRRHLGCGAKADPATSRMSLQITIYSRRSTLPFIDFRDRLLTDKTSQTPIERSHLGRNAHH